MAENEKKAENVGSNQDIWKYATGVLAVLFVAALVLYLTVPKTPVEQGTPCPILNNTNLTTASALTKEQASAKALAYVNTYLLAGRATAKVTDVSEDKGLYKISLDISGQVYETYSTKDGNIFFPDAIDISKPPAQAENQTQPAAQTIPKKDNPEVHLYTMSYCPYGNQAEQVAYPVYKLLGSSVEIQPHYVIYSNYGGGGPTYCLDAENKYCSMHGIQELHQDVRELCIYKYQKEKYWDFVVAVNSQCSAQNVDTCWEAVANSSGIDTAKIKTCEKDEAVALLQNEVDLNTKYSVRGSPMLVINGVAFNGGRTPEAYKQAICSAFTTAPALCNQTLNTTGAAAAGSC
jgi:hypothetical protein